jgi:hypothetical protein
MPWSRLIVAHGWWSPSLNTSPAERFRAALAACLAVMLLAAAARLAPAWPALALFVIVAVANRRLFNYFRERRGTMFAIGGVLYHQIYYLYSAASFAYCLAAYGGTWLRRRFKGRADAG